MISSELFNDIKAKPVVLVAAIALHFVLIILLGVNLSSSEIHKPASPDKKTSEGSPRNPGSQDPQEKNQGYKFYKFSLRPPDFRRLEW